MKLKFSEIFTWDYWLGLPVSYWMMSLSALLGGFLLPSAEAWGTTALVWFLLILSGLLALRTGWLQYTNNRKNSGQNYLEIFKLMLGSLGLWLPDLLMPTPMSQVMFFCGTGVLAWGIANFLMHIVLTIYMRIEAAATSTHKPQK